MISLKVVVNEQGPHLLFWKDYIGKGTEARVYRKGDVAYKCYHSFSFCDCLRLEDVQFLESLSTNCILLPQTTLYNIRGKFKGYTTRYIENLGLLHFMSLPTSLVVSNFKLLQEDCSILGNYHVLVSDFMPKDYRVQNHSFHNGLYFIDPGRYFRDYHCSVEDAIQKNKCAVDCFLFFRVLNRYATYEFGLYNNCFSKLYDIQKQAQSAGISLMDFITEDISEDNLADYVKRKVL